MNKESPTNRQLLLQRIKLIWLPSVLNSLSRQFTKMVTQTSKLSAI